MADARPQILAYLTEKGISKAELARGINVTRGYIGQILHEYSPLPSKLLADINEFLETDFPLIELLPHEQLEADKESIKDKPLFKDDSH